MFVSKNCYLLKESLKIICTSHVTYFQIFITCYHIQIKKDVQNQDEQITTKQINSYTERLFKYNHSELAA